MKMELPDIGPDERTPLVETLLGIIRQLMDRVAEAKSDTAAAAAFPRIARVV